jgi:hypothetical protein
MIFAISASSVNAAHLELTENNENKLCKTLFNEKLSNSNKSFQNIISSISDSDGLPVWKKGHINVKPAGSTKYIKRSFHYSRFDIDNDGDKEFILQDFASHYSESLRLPEKDIPMDGSLKIDWPQINLWPGVYSDSPWPYKKHGLYRINIYAFKFNNTYYLGLNDHFLGKRKFLDRSFVVVKYSNMMKENDAQWPYVTTELEIMCKFKYVP